MGRINKSYPLNTTPLRCFGGDKMATKDVTVLRNFAHISGAYIRGECRRIDESLANQFIDANLVSECEHEHEGDETPEGIIEVPDEVIDNPVVAMLDKPKARRGR